jgi:hypothetical protein
MTDQTITPPGTDGAPAAPPSGPAVDAAAVYDAVGRKGASRGRALEKADARLADAIAIVETALRAGVPLNLTECARRAGVSKQTVYNHLPPELVAARVGPYDPTDPDTEETEPCQPPIT